MKNFKKAKKITWITTAIITATISILYISLDIRKSNTEFEKQLDYTINSSINKIQNTFDIINSDIQLWMEYLTLSPLSEKNFNTISEIYCKNKPNIYSVEIVQNDIVDLCYPKERFYNQNINIVKDAEYRGAIEYLEENHDYGISGPHKGIANEKLFNIIKPVIINEKQAGYALFTINEENLFKSINLKGLEEYNYSFSVALSTTKNLFYRNLFNNLDKNTHVQKNYYIQTENANWFITGAYKDKKRPKELRIKIFSSLILIGFMAFIAFQVVDMIEKSQELETLSYKDPLTKISNRRKYSQIISRLHNEKTPYGLLYIDLNDFKKINDTYGHKTGDNLLKIIANKLQNCLRPNDIAFRIGGDEFAVILNSEQTKQSCESIKSRIEDSIERTTVLETLTMVPGISIGYSCYPQDGETHEIIERTSEKAMYQEKKRKKSER